MLLLLFIIIHGGRWVLCVSSHGNVSNNPCADDDPTYTTVHTY